MVTICIYTILVCNQPIGPTHPTTLSGMEKGIGLVAVVSAGNVTCWSDFALALRSISTHGLCCPRKET